MEYYKVPKKIRSVTDEDLTGLPKGFRFHPTDEEIVFHYLIPKTLNSNFRAAAIGQADFNKCEPWDLPKKANMGDTERYYYYQRDRKYPSGLRTNRATKAGYWKATGKDKEIYNGVGAGRELIGMKKTLVFYTGRAPNGVKTNWVMHEFRLHQNGQFSSIPKDDGWVISRVFHKIITTRTSSGNSSFPQTQEQDSLSLDETIINNNIESSLPDLVDPPSSDVSNSYDYLHQSVNIDVVYDDHQLIYSDDPDYYFPSLSETLHQTIDDCFGHDHKVEVSFDSREYDDFATPMPELRKVWDE